MNQCNLTQAQVREMFFYADGKLFWRKKTSRKTVVGNEAGTLCKNDGYRQIMINRRIYGTHRLVHLYHHGWIPEITDHINQNPTDNRIENLRNATRVENAYNCKLRSDNTSGVKGVTWCKNKQRSLGGRILHQHGNHTTYEHFVTQYKFYFGKTPGFFTW